MGYVHLLSVDGVGRRWRVGWRRWWRVGGWRVGWWGVGVVVGVAAFVLCFNEEVLGFCSHHGDECKESQREECLLEGGHAASKPKHLLVETKNKGSYSDD